MEHKLIMEKWRGYKEKVSLNESPQLAAWGATTSYSVAAEDSLIAEVVEAMIELAVIFLAEPGKVMSSKAWPIMTKYIPKLNVMTYQTFSLTPKALRSGKRKVWDEFISTPGIRDKLLKVLSNKKTILVVLQKTWIAVFPILGKTLTKASVLYMMYEVFQMSFGLTSVAMKRLGYRNMEDEMGNLDWTGVVKLARDALTGDHAYAKDAPKAKYDAAMQYTTENFDKWDEETQVGWCVRHGDAPEDYQGGLTCQIVLQRADPELIQRAKIAQSPGKSDEKFAMSVPAL